LVWFLRHGCLTPSILSKTYTRFVLFCEKSRLGVKSSNALRMNSRCTWRHREGSRNVDNTASRRALSPLRPCGSVTADVHGYPRGVAPSRPPIAIRDNPMAHTGGETTQSSHHSTGCAARPSLLFSPPGNGLSTRDARWKLLI